LDLSTIRICSGSLLCINFSVLGLLVPVIG
jgi:hypothetical protein